jgi:hypothetical protein
LTSPVTI